MKLLTSILVLFSLLFLFGGLAAVGVSSNELNIPQNPKLVHLKLEEQNYPNKILSINQIDSVTANSNYYFTSINAKGISVKSVVK